MSEIRGMVTLRWDFNLSVDPNKNSSYSGIIQPFSAELYLSMMNFQQGAWLAKGDDLVVDMKPWIEVPCNIYRLRFVLQISLSIVCQQLDKSKIAFPSSAIWHLLRKHEPEKKQRGAADVGALGAWPSKCWLSDVTLLEPKTWKVGFNVLTSDSLGIAVFSCLWTGDRAKLSCNIFTYIAASSWKVQRTMHFAQWLILRYLLLFSTYHPTRLEQCAVLIPVCRNLRDVRFVTYFNPRCRTGGLKCFRLSNKLLPARASYTRIYS